MSDTTTREDKNIDSASSLPLRERPENPGLKTSGPANKVSGDNRPDTKNAKSLPATKSLTNK